MPVSATCPAGFRDAPPLSPIVLRPTVAIGGAQWRVERSDVVGAEGRDRLERLLNGQVQLMGHLLGAW